MENNENPNICSACGGECCRTKPGIEAPDRFIDKGDPVEALYMALSSGDWVLDMHMGLPLTDETARLEDRMDRITYYPRPTTKEEKTKKVVTLGDGKSECVFLEKTGCRLAFADRPRMCRALEPENNFECSSSWTRPDAALAWFPIQSIVFDALKRF